MTSMKFTNPDAGIPCATTTDKYKYNSNSPTPVFSPAEIRTTDLAARNTEGFQLQHFGTATEIVLPSGLPITEDNVHLRLPSYNKYLIAIFNALNEHDDVLSLGHPAILITKDGGNMQEYVHGHAYGYDRDSEIEFSVKTGKIEAKMTRRVLPKAGAKEDEDGFGKTRAIKEAFSTKKVKGKYPTLEEAAAFARWFLNEWLYVEM